MTDKYNEFKKWINQSKYGFINTQEMELEPDKKIFEKFESKENTTIKKLQNICQKYRIPFNDLPEVLEEYIATDNEEYLEKIRRQKTYE